MPIKTGWGLQKCSDKKIISWIPSCRGKTILTGCCLPAVCTCIYKETFFFFPKLREHYEFDFVACFFLVYCNNFLMSKSFLKIQLSLYFLDSAKSEMCRKYEKKKRSVIPPLRETAYDICISFQAVSVLAPTFKQTKLKCPW